mmetsp:Transcript_56127/g.91380  ORF Transcript_56127/g.91380 Transcript_56127/m.91380 type:complete len:86 (+) Transcript_56127:367-624(+)
MRLHEDLEDLEDWEDLEDLGLATSTSRFGTWQLTSFDVLRLEFLRPLLSENSLPQACRTGAGAWRGTLSHGRMRWNEVGNVVALP